MSTNNQLKSSSGGFVAEQYSGNCKQTKKQLILLTGCEFLTMSLLQKNADWPFPIKKDVFDSKIRGNSPRCGRILYSPCKY